MSKNVTIPMYRRVFSLALAFVLALGLISSLPAQAAPPKVTGHIRVATESDIANKVEYIISLEGMQNVLNVTLTVEVSGGMLTDGELSVLHSGFTALADEHGETIRWTDQGNDVWTGEFLLMNLTETGFTSEQSVDIAKVLCTATQEGSATMKLTGLIVAGLDETNTVVFFESEIGTSEATTTVIPTPPEHSIYDLNRDGKVDQCDLGIAQLYYRAEEGDANWDEAKKCDFVAVKGVIDMLDLLDLFRNFTV